MLRTIAKQFYRWWWFASHENSNAGLATVDGHVAHFGGSDSPNQHYNWNFGDGTLATTRSLYTRTRIPRIYSVLGGLGLESANAGHVL
ncbi:MAG: hypothetical protein IPL86_13390 [Flavobacteriales bacterium]|nr:hypothetical protein [Flavobacteriales bacterium]